MEQIPAGTLVVVADGGSARIFRNVAEPPALSLVQIDQATFAKQLAQQLNEGALKQRYAHVVLVADPRTLGEIRPQLHKETQARLVRELDRDLTNVPLPDIERALA